MVVGRGLLEVGVVGEEVATDDGEGAIPKHTMLAPLPDNDKYKLMHC